MSLRELEYTHTHTSNLMDGRTVPRTAAMEYVPLRFGGNVARRMVTHTSNLNRFNTGGRVQSSLTDARHPILQLWICSAEVQGECR